MTTRTLLVTLALLAAAPALAGCTKGVETLRGDVVARAEDARVSDSWAYDGAGVRNAVGTAEIDVQDRTNAGLVTFEVDDGLDVWRLDWTTFAASRDFHDGGIARDLQEHGATGVGDGAIPEVEAIAAAWGEARLYRNGQLVRDPSTGNETLKAHFMLVKGTLRGEDGTIMNATRERLFDPATPGDGYVSPNGTELFVTLSSHEPAPPFRFFKVFEFRQVTIGEEERDGLNLG